MSWPMFRSSRLAHVPELLDGPLDDSEAVADNLRDLRRINRLFRAAAMSRRAIEALVPGTGSIRLLDVGTGGADIPLSLLAIARRAGQSLTVTAVDSRPEVLGAARAVNRRADGRLDQIVGLTLAVADGRRLPYPDRAFDVGHASLLLHHLEPPDALALLRELRRVSRFGIVVNDLARGRLNWLAAWLLTRTIARSRFTRHDGPLSVRRAYSVGEMREMLREAGVTPVATIHGFARHRYAIAAR
jgi:ubiquinone/menaquinone biosynthesis C-methylase UbiE